MKILFKNLFLFLIFCHAIQSNTSLSELASLKEEVTKQFRAKEHLRGRKLLLTDTFSRNQLNKQQASNRLSSSVIPRYLKPVIPSRRLIELQTHKIRNNRLLLPVKPKNMKLTQQVQKPPARYLRDNNYVSRPRQNRLQKNQPQSPQARYLKDNDFLLKQKPTPMKLQNRQRQNPQPRYLKDTELKGNEILVKYEKIEKQKNKKAQISKKSKPQERRLFDKSILHQRVRREQRLINPVRSNQRQRAMLYRKRSANQNTERTRALKKVLKNRRRQGGFYKNMEKLNAQTKVRKLTIQKPGKIALNQRRKYF